jgi:hypothetical protein
LALQREAEAGVGARNVIDAAVANLIHVPSVGGRSLQVDAIGDRVLSQSGRVVARRREDGVIPQVQQPARVPAAISSAAVVNNIARSQPAADDPFLQALLAIRSQEDAIRDHFRSPKRPQLDLKLVEEARSIQVSTQIRQYEFARDNVVFESDLRKREMLEQLRNQILGSQETVCGLCQSSVTGLVYGVARMPCCGNTLHTSCLILMPNRLTCPFCRVVQEVPS